jgi:hypothetical protein
VKKRRVKSGGRDPAIEGEEVYANRALCHKNRQARAA